MGTEEKKNEGKVVALNHPYMSKLQSTLAAHYNLHERLMRRVVLIKENFSTKSEHEQNDIEIAIIKTKNEADSLKRVIQAREDYFRRFIRQFALDFDEAERNYESTLSEAKKKIDKVKGMRQLLDTVNWTLVEENAEAKIKLYQRLKKMLS